MVTQAAASHAAEKPLEKLTVHFTVLSPIHIGTREGALQPMEFLFDGRQVHVVDETKLGRFLMQKNLMDTFVQHAFSGELRKKGLHGFLREKLRDADFAKIGAEVSAYSVPGGSPDMGDFRPFVRDGFGRVYLPGTSIKGVLRTAFLYALLKEEGSGSRGQPHPREGRVTTWIRDLRDKPKKYKERTKKFLSAPLQEDLLQSWTIPGNAHDQNRDILRCLKVRDAYPLNGKVHTRVIPIRFLSKRADGSHYWSQKPKGNGDLVIWVEAVAGGTFQAEILWDHDLWAKFSKENPRKKLPAASAKGVLLLADRMNRDLSAHEKAFFTEKGIPEGALLKSWYETLGGSIFRIGFGSGMLSTTVNLLWSHSLRQEIRNVCGLDRGTDPAPKSRRVWVSSDGRCLPMGWARVTLPDGAAPAETKPKPAPPGPGGTGKPNDREKPPAEPQPRPKVSLQEETAPRDPSVPSGGPPKTSTVPGTTPTPPARPTAPTPRPGTPGTPPSPSVGLVDKARAVALTNKIAMERLFEEMERADESLARKAAEVLKERLERQNLWKRTPFRTTIEEYLG
uniref:CRISPR system Cms protein Csm5 n=1 Tax=Desulfacinum infernum TaxID=35837 RepID=A0A831ZNN2_9BACT